MKLKSLFFKTPILNLIFGLLILAASIIELIGYFWVAEIEYFTDIIRFLMGGLLIVYGIYLIAIYFKKKSSVIYNVNVIVISSLIMMHGVFNMVLGDHSAHYFALAIFLTGALLTIISSIKRSSIYYTYAGILVIIASFIAYLMLKESYFIYTLLAVLFVISIIMIVIGISEMSKKKR